MEPAIFYDVLSPDHLSINGNELFPSKDAARAGFAQWIKRYEHQGYYSTGTRAHIALPVLHKYCTVQEFTPIPQEQQTDEESKFFPFEANGKQYPFTLKD